MLKKSTAINETRRYAGVFLEALLESTQSRALHTFCLIVEFDLAEGEDRHQRCTVQQRRAYEPFAVLQMQRVIAGT